MTTQQIYSHISLSLNVEEAKELVLAFKAKGYTNTKLIDNYLIIKGNRKNPRVIETKLVEHTFKKGFLLIRESDLTKDHTLVYKVDNSYRVVNPKSLQQFKTLQTIDNKIEVVVLHDTNEGVTETAYLVSITEFLLYAKSRKLVFWKRGDKFDESEFRGRVELLRTFPNVDFTFTKGKYDAYDAVAKCSKTGLPIIVEVKNRNCTSTTYNSGLFEKNKMTKLIEEQDKMGAVKILYVSHFTDKVTAVWNINKYIGSDFINWLQPKTTSGSNHLVTKQLIELPIKEATIYNR